MQALEVSSATAKKKEKFNNDFEYFMSTLGFSAGFGSIWRFPYLRKNIN